jgi:hypothetical protein
LPESRTTVSARISSWHELTNNSCSSALAGSRPSAASISLIERRNVARLAPTFSRSACGIVARRASTSVTSCARVFRYSASRCRATGSTPASCRSFATIGPPPGGTIRAPIQIPTATSAIAAAIDEA